MSQIEVPDWVVEIAARVVAKNVGEDYDSLGPFTQDTIKATQRECITAALGAWVVQVAVSREHDAGRPSFYDVVPNDSQEAEMWAYALVPLYNLRQEKPE